VQNGQTALIIASAKGHTATVEVLLKAGADKDAKDKVGDRKREAHTHPHMWLKGCSA
jgi:ankyrin repeat protein